MRWIFDAYLKGRSSGWIAEQLTARHPLPVRRGMLERNGVRYLLTNEKIHRRRSEPEIHSCGFPFVQKRNHGERLQYYTENSHPAIIDRDTFLSGCRYCCKKSAEGEKAQRKKAPCLKNRLRELRDGVSAPKQPERICDLGLPNPRPPRRGLPCRTHPETEIHAAFLRMYHRLKSNADIILAPALRQLNTLDTILRQNHPQVRPSTGHRGSNRRKP